jgi:SAM-dependent methyltransferase
MHFDEDGMPAPEKNGFIATLNKTGFMTSKLDEYSQAFVDYCAKLHTDQVALEIGAAYGVASLKVLESGIRLVSNDLDKSHLEVIQKKARKLGFEEDLLECVEGDFLKVLDNQNYHERFQAILCCRVLHFLDPEAIRNAFHLMARLLEKGGRLFIVAETCFLKNFKDFLPTYMRLLEAQKLFAGHISDVHAVAPERGSQLPKMMTFLDVITLEHLAKENDLEIIKCATFARPDFPEDIQLDGRESVGLIVTKRQ